MKTKGFSSVKRSVMSIGLAYLGGISIIRPMVAMLLIMVLLSSAMVTRAQVRVPKETNKYIQIGAKVLGAIPNPYVKALGGAVGFLFAAEEEPAWAERKAELEKSWRADIADKSKEDYKTFINARKKAYLRDLDLIAIAQNTSPEEAMDQARVLAGIVRTDIPLFHENAGGKPYPARPTLPYLYAAMSLYLDLVKTQIDWAQYDLTMKIAADNAGAATVARGRRDALVEQYNKQLVVYWKTLQRETIRAKQETTGNWSACDGTFGNPECKKITAQIINETNSYDLADYGVYKTSFDNRAPVLYSCSIRMKKHRDYDDGQRKGPDYFAQVNLVCPVPGGMVQETGFWSVRSSLYAALKEGGEVVPFSVNYYWFDLWRQTDEFVFKAYLSGQNPRKGYRFSINEDTTFVLAVDADDLEKSQTVTNINDSGPGSLRQAIEDGGRINIDAIQGQTITLMSGPLYIYSRDVKIMADNLKQPVKIVGQRGDKIFVVSGDAKFYNDHGTNLYNLLDVDGKDLKCGVNPSVTANAPPVTTCPGVGQ